MFSEKQYNPTLNILFITLAAYLGVTGLYKSVTAGLEFEDVAEASVHRSMTREEAPARPLSDYIAIEKRNLFKTGDAVKPAAAPEPPPEIDTLKQTARKLRLWGTVTGDKDRAYAVIEEGKKRYQNLFREGYSLEGATGKQILREKIVLTVGGKDEILSMEKPPAGENPRLSRAMPTAGGAPNPFARAAGDSAPSGSKRIALGRAEVEDAVNNVNTLMRQARIRPHFKDGKPDGLTLSRIQRDSIFTKLGLRTGDVIVGVDGQQIESVDDALKFYNSLKSSPNVQLQIRRRGQLQNIDYAIE